MKVYEYSRVSTSHQNFAQQHNSVQEYLAGKGWTIAETVMDEGVSGGVSYRDRNLYRLIQRMNEGDVLIVSEISRLGRSMSDLSKLVNDELKPRKIRLIVVKMGLDLDCSSLKAIDEMILFAFSFAAQIEKELIQERTQSALDVRKQKLAKGETFISKSGNVCAALGRPKGCAASGKSIEASRAALRDTALNNPNNIAFRKYMELYEEQHGRITPNTGIRAFTEQLNRLGYKTARGLDFNDARAWSMLRKVRELYAS